MEKDEAHHTTVVVQDGAVNLPASVKQLMQPSFFIILFK